MPRIKPSLLSGVAIAFLVALISPAEVQAGGTCSGDDCGCGIALYACTAACPTEPQEAFIACVGECKREDKECSIACCTVFAFAGPLRLSDLATETPSLLASEAGARQVDSGVPGTCNPEDSPLQQSPAETR